MGMFDDLRCDMPLPDAEASGLEIGHWFQTKDMDCYLDKYAITEHGRLIALDWDAQGQVFIPGADKNYHGMLNFYTLTMDKRWFEYDAKFTDGKVTEIQGGKRP